MNPVLAQASPLPSNGVTSVIVYQGIAYVSGQLPRIDDGLAVVLEDYVADLDAGAGSGAVGFDLCDQSAAGRGHLERVRQRLIERLNLDAEPRMSDLAGFDDLILHLNREIYRDGE